MFFTVSLISLCVGCGGQPEFVHRAEYDDLAPYAQDYVSQILDDHFGKPIPTGDEVLLGPEQVLSEGHMLYAEHCQHCHGVTGDGNGPTARYLNPKPRDFRLGVFKFTTTKQEHRAAREDLVRIIENGIPGTYMPSFKLLTKDEMTATVDYVLWLARRGELEYRLVSLLSEEGYTVDAVQNRVSLGENSQSIQTEFTERVNDPEEFPAAVDRITTRITTDWEESQTPPALVQPLTPRIPYTPESVAKGRELYLNENLKCADCHGTTGRGNGPQVYAVSKMRNGEDYPDPGLHDEWGNLLQPRDLHAGIFRGGRRPIDLYSRIYAGIKGTPMPPFATLIRRQNPDDPTSPLTDEDLWHLVNYIYSIPLDGRVPEHDPGGDASDPKDATAHSVN